MWTNKLRNQQPKTDPKHTANIFNDGFEFIWDLLAAAII